MQAKRDPVGESRGRQPRCWRLLRGVEGAQLVEFAFTLPLLLVLLVGMIDFGKGYNLKQKLTNAAREGARIGSSLSTADKTQANPTTVQATRDAVINYLNNAGVPTTLTSTTPCASASFSWTYCLAEQDSSGNSGQIKIDRPFAFDPDAAAPGTPCSAGSACVLGTRVTLTYPFDWSFDRIILLLAPSASYSNSFMLSSEGVMENIGGGA